MTEGNSSSMDGSLHYVSDFAVAMPRPLNPSPALPPCPLCRAPPSGSSCLMSLPPTQHGGVQVVDSGASAISASSYATIPMKRRFANR